METNYKKENEQFETWWNKITAKNGRWTTLERMSAHDAWMEARGVFKQRLERTDKKMEEKEFITMLEDLIYAEQELSDDYYKATNKAIDLLDKLKAKQLSIHIVVKSF